MRKSGLVSLVGISALAIGLLIASLAVGNSPLLGLDLQGGVEVVLRPTEGQEVNSESLDLSAEIIRRRIDSLGVAEPDVTRQGSNLVVQLPGVDDQQRAVDLIGQTGKLEFRPVYSASPLLCNEGLLETKNWILPGDTLIGLTNAYDVETVRQINREIEAAMEESNAAIERGDEVLGVPQCEGIEPPVTETPDTATEDAEENPFDAAYLEYFENRDLLVSSPISADPEEFVIYVGESIVTPGTFLKYILGPAQLDGSALRGASAQLTGVSTWFVQLNFRSGGEGIDLFNNAARICATQQPSCPLRQLGITLDGAVESTPQVAQVSFDPDNIAIQGDFTRSEARNLALILRYGALPLEFDDPVEAGLVRSVSATLGNDSLRAGVIAGSIGIFLVALYMIFYYRLVGLAAMLSLAISGVLLWVIISFLSETQGLALTLAGITGLIVSIGVSLDSNVVYFEHLKEDLSNGKTLRSSTDQAFPIAFKTIFWANLATLIGAGILWWLAIGSVRGFAAILGIASVLDLVVTYFFLRPAVKILARSNLIKFKPKWLIGVKDSAPA